MYEQFFGFRERPFDLTPNPRFLVMTEAHREVLSNLEYAITSRKGLTVVLGEAGSGKTTLIRTVLRGQPEQVHIVHLTNPTLTREEFLETLAGEFALSADAVRSKALFLRELNALLRGRRERGDVTVLIVDEAQSVPPEILEEIRLLANIETDDEKLMCVILAGQPELADRLDEPRLRQLKQRVALRCQLRPLTHNETADYLVGRVKAAGGVGAQVFTKEAVALIYEGSGGLPRMISVLADNALLGGLAAGMKPVKSDIVRDVCRDFGVPLKAARAAPVDLLPARPGALFQVAADPHAAAAPAAAESAPDDMPETRKGLKRWSGSWGRRRGILGL